MDLRCAATCFMRPGTSTLPLTAKIPRQVQSAPRGVVPPCHPAKGRLTGVVALGICFVSQHRSRCLTDRSSSAWRIRRLQQGDGREAGHHGSEVEKGSALRGDFEQELEETFKKVFDSVPPRVVIIGKRGVGKTTLANSLRGLSPQDERAAKVGADETTLGDGNQYQYAGMVFHDLPGCEGSEESVGMGPDYIEKYDLSVADACIFVYTSVLEPRMLNCAQTLQEEHDVPIFLVRNMVGSDCRNDVEDGNAENIPQAFEKIKHTAYKQIQSVGHDSFKLACNDRLFLIESKYKDAVKADPPSEPFQREFHRLKKAVVHDIRNEAKRAQVHAIFLKDAKALAKARADECRRAIAGHTALGAVLGPVPLFQYYLREKVLRKFMDKFYLTEEALKDLSGKSELMEAVFGRRMNVVEVLDQVALNVLDGWASQGVMMNVFCRRTIRCLTRHAEKFYEMQMWGKIPPGA